MSYSLPPRQDAPPTEQTAPQNLAVMLPNAKANHLSWSTASMTAPTSLTDAEVEQQYLGLDLQDPGGNEPHLGLKIGICALLAAAFLVDLRYAQHINITPLYVIVIFLTLTTRQVRWVLGVTALSLLLNLIATRWHTVTLTHHWQYDAVINHLLVAVGAQIPAGILCYRSLIGQRKAEQNRAETSKRQKAAYERERAAREAEVSARHRETLVAQQERVRADELARIVDSERDARRREQEATRREQEARGEHAHLRQLTEKFQRALLPQVPTEIGGRSLAIGSLYQPAIQEMQMGGDFYDAIPLPDGSVGLLIGDVAGHGVEAAAQTALVTTLLRAFAPETPNEPATVMQRLNHAVTLDRQFRSFVTMFYGVYSPETGELRYCNAGHEPPLLLKQSGEIEPMASTGLVVGVDKNAVQSEQTTRLCAGDCLILFTDGITEARHPNGKDMLGSEGVAEIAQRYYTRAASRPGTWVSPHAAADLADTIYHAAVSYAGGDADGNQGLSDDVALLTVMALNEC